MKITFLGAAGEVTGSQHLIETSEVRLLLDCGLFQGPRRESREKNEVFKCNPKDLDGVILSHAHIDHCGNMPRLYRQGYEGDIFCTNATADITEVMLRDAAKIQQEDARYLTRKLGRSTVSFEPLYDNDDVDELKKGLQGFDFGQWHSLSHAVKVRFHQAGHILGSAIVELELLDAGDWKRVVFTGDLGRRGLPLLVDPTPIERCDVLITESTYGSRVHPPAGDLKQELKRIFHEASVVGGRVVIPAFSLGRTQQVLYFLNELFNAGELARMPIYVDSPLSRKLTTLYREHVELMDDDVQQTLRNDPDPFGFEWLRFTSSVQESKAINEYDGAVGIIASSGMCEAGRIVHHLRQAISHPENTVAIIGYQAPHTLGRRIANREPRVKIFGKPQELRCHVEELAGLSAHADANDFHWWFEQIGQQGGIGQAFIVHGEQEGARGVQQLLRPHCDHDPIIPQRFDSFEV